MRREPLLGYSSWEALDTPTWVEVDDEAEDDAETFFHYLSQYLS